jgi:hypothetical protein
MRARNIKPGFFKNPEIAECSILARLLAPGLWMMADREGRLEDRPKKIKIEILPCDDANIDELLNELVKASHIIRYEIDGIKYIQINKFVEHQRPHHMEEKSEIPPPPGTKNRYNHDPLTVPQRRRIYERDGQKCLICGSSENLHIDHIIPVSRGGTSDDGNLRTLCKDCNVSKGNRDDISLRRKKQIKDEMYTSRSHDEQHALHPTDTLLLDSLNPESSSLRSEVAVATPKPPKVTIPEKPKAGRGTRLSPDWDLPDDWGEWAEQQGMTRESIIRECDKFKDFWISKSGSNATKADWEATWRNWIRRHLEEYAK